MAATSTKTRGSATKKVAGKSATKTAKKAAPSASPTKAVAKKVAGKAPARVVMFDGKPAKNAHFEVSLSRYNAAQARAGAEDTAISEVMRAGLADYAKKTPAAAKRAAGAKTVMPAAGVKGLKAVFKSGDSMRISAYMSALASAGWPLQVIADAIVGNGLATKFSRQAVSLRVLKAQAADAPKFDDLPDVPQIGARRPYPAMGTGGGTRALARSKAGRLRTDLKDVTMRIANEDYDKAMVRAKFEGAKITAVLDSYLEAYAAGTFDVSDAGRTPRKVAAAATVPLRKPATKKAAAKKATTKKASTKKAAAKA